MNRLREVSNGAVQSQNFRLWLLTVSWLQLLLRSCFWALRLGGLQQRARAGAVQEPSQRGPYNDIVKRKKKEKRKKNELLTSNQLKARCSWTPRQFVKKRCELVIKYLSYIIMELLYE